MWAPVPSVRLVVPAVLVATARLVAASEIELGVGVSFAATAVCVITGVIGGNMVWAWLLWLLEVDVSAALGILQALVSNSPNTTPYWMFSRAPFIIVFQHDPFDPRDIFAIPKLLP
jgi:hypothetical protein